MVTAFDSDPSLVVMRQRLGHSESLAGYKELAQRQCPGTASSSSSFSTWGLALEFCDERARCIQQFLSSGISPCFLSTLHVLPDQF